MAPERETKDAGSPRVPERNPRMLRGVGSLSSAKGHSDVYDITRAIPNYQLKSQPAVLGEACDVSWY